MRIFGTVTSWPPTWTDEVASLLGQVGTRLSRRESKDDVRYGLTTALAELDTWISLMPNDKRPPGDRASMLIDVTTAFATRGPRVQHQSPSATDLLDQLPHAVSGSADKLRRLTRATRIEMAQPSMVVAAFDDLVESVKSPATPPRMITDRLDVLVGLLQLSERPAGQVCRMIGGIVDDGAYEIDAARHELDGTPLRDHPRPDARAGLAPDDRLEICRRYLQHPEQRGHYVIWFVYQNARLAMARHWRQRVGEVVEFFDGPTMLKALAHPEQVFQPEPLPDELLKPLTEGGIGIDHSHLWPEPDDLKWWVAARVELGAGQFSDPVRLAREQADAVVQVAIFNSPGTSTWRPSDGYIVIIDGDERGSQRPFYSRREYLAEYDHTGDELAALSESIGPHLPINNPILRRLLDGVSTLNTASRSSDPDLLTHDVRVIELVRKECEFPSWGEFVSANRAINTAYNDMCRQIVRAVLQVLDDHDMSIVHAIPDRNGMHARVNYYRSESEGMVTDLGAALQVLVELVDAVPDHNTNARQLRHIAEQVKDVDHLRQWLTELTAEFTVKLNRTIRFRNGLIHGGAADEDVARTIRHFLSGQARIIADQALQAVIQDKSVKNEFEDLRKHHRLWRTRITNSASVHDALFAVL